MKLAKSWISSRLKKSLNLRYAVFSPKLRAGINLLKPFRAVDGSFDNPTNILCLHLDDFATDAMSIKWSSGSSTEVNISYKKLANFLNKAEAMQESRELAQGSVGQGIKLTRKTRKRRRSSSPFDQLRSDDEHEHLKQEVKAEEKTDAADSDFRFETLVDDRN